MIAEAYQGSDMAYHRSQPEDLSCYGMKKSHGFRDHHCRHGKGGEDTADDGMLQILEQAIGMSCKFGDQR